MTDCPHIVTNTQLFYKYIYRIQHHRTICMVAAKSTAKKMSYKCITAYFLGREVMEGWVLKTSARQDTASKPFLMVIFLVSRGSTSRRNLSSKETWKRDSLNWEHQQRVKCYQSKSQAHRRLHPHSVRWTNTKLWERTTPQSYFNPSEWCFP